MRWSKDLLKGVVVGSIVSVILSSAAAFAVEKVYKTKNGATFPAANFAVGKEVIPEKNMPDGIPPVLIDGRTFIPLRAAVNAVGGDVSWDGNSRTASVRLASNIIIFRNGEPTDFIEKNEGKNIKFLASVPIEMLDTYTNYESTWVIEHENGKMYGGESMNTQEVTNRGINSYYTSTTYNFFDVGVHTIKFKVRKAGTNDWTVVAQRKLKVE